MGTESLAGGEYWDFLIDAPMAEWHQADPQSRRAPAGFLGGGGMGDVSHPCVSPSPLQGTLIQHLKEHMLHGNMTSSDILLYYTTVCPAASCCPSIRGSIRGTRGGRRV